MVLVCRLVDGRVRSEESVNRKPPQTIDEAMLCLEVGRAAFVAEKDMPELERRFDVREMLSDPEYAIPGELDESTRGLRIDSLERRVRHLETIVHRILNEEELDGRE